MAIENNTVIKEAEEDLLSTLTEHERKRWKEWELIWSCDRAELEAMAEEKGMKRGMKKGIKQGIEQGIAQGKKETEKAIAKELLKKKLDEQTIKEITKLSQEELEMMKKELSLE